MLVYCLLSDSRLGAQSFALALIESLPVAVPLREFVGYGNQADNRSSCLCMYCTRRSYSLYLLCM